MNIYVNNPSENTQINTIAKLAEDGLSDLDISKKLTELGYKYIAATDGVWTETRVKAVINKFSLGKTDRPASSAPVKTSLTKEPTQAKRRISTIEWLVIALLIGIVCNHLIGKFSPEPSESETTKATSITSSTKVEEKTTEFKKVILNKDAVICFERDDWESMTASIRDSNLQQMRILIESARCQTTIRNTNVLYLDPVRGNSVGAFQASCRVNFLRR